MALICTINQLKTLLFVVTWISIVFKLKYEVLKLGDWMSDPYLYYYSIKDTPVCGHLDFNCLKLKYEVNHDILLFILAPGYTVSTWGCVVLTVYDRHQCQTISKFTG